jgi:hypothetical protein
VAVAVKLAPVLSSVDPVAGETLSIAPGDYTPAATETYQWTVDGSDRGTGATLALNGSDAGKTVRVTVTASAPGALAWSAVLSTAKVAQATSQPAVVQPKLLPQLSAVSPAAGETIAVVPGDYSPAANEAYEWTVDGAAAGSGRTLALNASHVGKVVRVTVTALASGAQSWSATLSTAAVAAAPTTPPPATPVVGALALPQLSTLTPTAGESVWVLPGTYSPAATESYEWLFNGAIAGSERSFQVPAWAQGATLQVRVTATAPGATPWTAVLSAAPAAPAPPSAVEVRPKNSPQLSSLAPVEGARLYVIRGDYSPAADEAYAWFVDGAAAGSGSFFDVPADARGKVVTVAVTATAPAAAPWTVTLATAPVEPRISTPEPTQPTSTTPADEDTSTDPPTAPADTPAPPQPGASGSAPAPGGSPSDPALGPALDPGAAPAAPPVTDVKVAQKTVTLAKGNKLTLAGRAYTEAGDGAKVTWSSSDAKVVTVSAKGVVKAKRAGKAVLTAKSGAETWKVKVTVVKAGADATKVKSVLAKGVKKKMAVGQTAWLTGVVKPASALGAKVTFTSSKPAVAAVDKAGRVLAKKAGKTVITVKAGSKSKKYKVTVK